MARLTDRFGFQIIEQGDNPYINGHKFFAADRDRLDSLLWLSLSGHHHTGGAASVPTLDNALDLELATTGGAIAAGTRLWYLYTLVDQSTGIETIASPVTFIDTPDPVTPPDRPALAWGSTTGTLLPGQYFYILSAYTDVSTNETNSLNAQGVLIPVGTSTNRVIITLPDLPAGADGFNLYRRTPGGSRYLHLATIDMTVATPPSTYIDDGTVEEDCDRTNPTRNTTNSTNAITVTIPGATPAVPDGYYWKIYRTITEDDWSASLLQYVVEETFEGSGVITPTFEDLGFETLTGEPPLGAFEYEPPEKILLTGGAEVQGLLPASMIDGGVGGVATVLVAGSDSTAEVLAVADYPCDGTNDEVQLQAAIDSFNGSAGIVEVTGTVQVQAVTTVSDNWPLVIRGMGRDASGFLTPARIVRTGGTGAILNLQSMLVLDDMAIQDEGTAGRTTSLILMDGGGLDAHDCVFANAQPTGHCIEYVFGSEDTKIYGGAVSMTNASSGDFIGMPVDETPNIIIDGTEMHVANGYAVDWASTASSTPNPFVSIRNCWTNDGTQGCDGFIRVSEAGNPDLRVSLINNTIRGNSEIAVDLTECIIEIVGNIIGRSGNPTTSLGTTAIKLTSCTEGGVVEGNQILHAGHHGIWLLDSSDLSILNNNIRSVGRTTTATYSGIILDGNSDRNTVTGNTIRKASSGNVPLYGIRIDDSTCNDNFVKGNDVFNASGTNGNEIVDAGTGTRGFDWFTVELSDETTAIASTGQKAAYRMPSPFLLSKLRAFVNSASASAGPLTIDVEEAGVSLLSTLLTIDDTELTSTTAASQSVVSDRYVADDAVVTFDLDDAGDGAATGLKVTVYGWFI